MTADREALVAEVAGVLAEHHWGDDTAPVGRFAMRCGCGWKQSAVASRIYDLRARHDRHRAHALADLLAARDRRVRAEALREAAEAIDVERASIEPKNHATFAARLGMSNAARLVRDKADA